MKLDPRLRVLLDPKVPLTRTYAADFFIKVQASVDSNGYYCGVAGVEITRGSVPVSDLTPKMVRATCTPARMLDDAFWEMDAIYERKTVQLSQLPKMAQGVIEHAVTGV